MDEKKDCIIISLIISLLLIPLILMAVSSWGRIQESKSSIAAIKEERKSMEALADEENWDVYVNGTAVEMENIQLSAYENIFFDEENKKVIITVR